MIGPGAPAANDVGVRARGDIGVRVVHFGEEASVADVVVLARPELLVSVVRAINGVTVESEANELQALVAELELASLLHVVKDVVEAARACLAPLFLREIFFEVVEAARQHLVYDVVVGCFRAGLVVAPVLVHRRGALVEGDGRSAHAGVKRVLTVGCERLGDHDAV